MEVSRGHSPLIITGDKPESRRHGTFQSNTRTVPAVERTSVVSTVSVLVSACVSAGELGLFWLHLPFPGILGGEIQARTNPGHTGGISAL